MAWVAAGPVNELRPGLSKCVVVDGRRIAIFNVGGTIYAVDDDCPHDEGGRLSRGTLQDRSVWCPLHGAAFSVVTGQTLEPPEGEDLTPPVTRGVRVYAVNIVGDQIYLDV